MGETKHLNHRDEEAFKALLIGRKVELVEFTNSGELNAVGTLKLDDGTVLNVTSTDGGCACSSGCYDLTTLNGVDNIITDVKLYNSPDGDDVDGEGRYTIFVFADNEMVNLATWTGSDGNGYYGTGYSIEVTFPDA